MRTKYLLFVFMVAFLALNGCSRPINRAAERRIRDVLPNIIGTAKRYTAHVDNPPERTIEGKLATVTITGEDVHFKNGLLVDNLNLTLKGVEVDTDTKRLRKIRRTEFTITVGEANVNEYLVDEIMDGETLRNIRIKFFESVVTISGQRVVLGIGVPFEITGPLRITGPTLVELDATRLKVVGLPFKGRVLDFIKHRMDTVADLSGFSFPMLLNEVKVTSGKLVLSGTANPMPLLDTRPLW